MRRQPPAVLGAIVAALVLIALITVLQPRKVTNGRPLTADIAIPVAGGVQLAAHVYLPTGSGLHPLVVMPASWGASATEYKVVGAQFAAHGYVVLAYAQRGFIPSTGQIDFAGTATQQDVGSVITWALQHTASDPDRIGMLGISYGAGMSLLAAEHDPRIKAVVAMSGWSDLFSSFFPNGTPNTQAVLSLFNAQIVAHLDPPISSFVQAIGTGAVTDARAQFAALSPIRSPITDVADLNKNRTAVMIANDFQDSYFAPNQLVTFFDELTVPKRLQLAAGDHGSQEVPGLRGQPSTVWTDARQWLDHYLRGTNNGIQNQQPVQLRDVTTDAWHSYPAWPSQATTMYLDGAADARSMGPTAVVDWTQRITTGTQTIGKTAPIEIGVFPYRVLTGVPLNTASHDGAALWAGQPSAAPTPVAGEPAVHVTVTPSAATTTLFAYLYDADPTGNGTLITSAPYTLSNAAPGAATAVDINLAPIAWTLPAGHHLTLLINTVSQRYTTLGKDGQTVTFSSPASDPSRLTVPVG